MQNFIVATLANGLRILNFSIPQGVRFEDGTHLAAISDAAWAARAARRSDTVTRTTTPSGAVFATLAPHYTLSDSALEMLGRAERSGVDVVLVDRETLTALRAQRGDVGLVRVGLRLDMSGTLAIDRFEV